jgi:hypothetical protein
VSESQAIKILSVSSKQTLRQFLRVPYPIYRGDPNWVPPLLVERKHHLSHRNPVFEHLRWGAWVANRGGRTVGRISAQIDDLHQQLHADDTGFFGMIESVDDVAVFRVLLDTAGRWLKDRGMRRVRGPFNLNINEECGLLVDGFDTPPSLMMGHARPDYRHRLAECGFVGVQDTLAYQLAPDFEAPKVMQRLLSDVTRRATIRPLRRDRLDQELATLRDIFNDAWSANWGFVPFTEAEFAEIGRTMLLLACPEMVQIAEVDGRPAAMIVALPNLNEVIADMGGRLLPINWAKLLWRLKVRYPRSARVPLMGVRREFQNTRLGPGLAFAVIDSVRKILIRRGIREVELSWILEDNMGMRNIIEALGGVAYKRYRIFEKSLGE